MSDAGNPIKNIDDMNRQESALDEMLFGSCPTTSSARNGGLAKSEEEEKNASNDASSPPATVPEGDDAPASQANQIVMDKDKLLAVLREMELARCALPSTISFLSDREAVSTATIRISRGSAYHMFCFVLLTYPN